MNKNLFMSVEVLGINKVRKMASISAVSIGIFVVLNMVVQGALAGAANDEILNVWQDFIEVVAVPDCQKLEQLTSQKIRCYSCLENTPEESSVLDALRDTDSEWYDKLYNDKIYVPVDVFCKNDVPIIFNKPFLSRLRSGKTIYVDGSENGVSYYEILVTTTEPGEVDPNHEGAQHVFQFIKTDMGYKFNSIDTIP